ncbi:VOC family protein [Fictibacillus iocasae]|uniref:VOC family protein n=1 Tax=Fictibacillus iocasae TaxID=2715437 RepID=A0ABW2NST3_9BACL
MKIQKANHMGVIVNDLSAATAFFLDIGLELKGQWDVNEEWILAFTGVPNTTATCTGFGASDDHIWIELIQFHSAENVIPERNAHPLNIQHIAFKVEDMESIVAKLNEKGTAAISEIKRYEKTCKLCYVRGPEGIIVELSETIQ